jgi:thioredoxin 1
MKNLLMLSTIFLATSLAANQLPQNGVVQTELNQEMHKPEKVKNSKVIKVESMGELMDEVSSSELVFVDCYTSTCPPCKALAPKFAQLSKDLSSKGKFVKVDLDEVSEVQQKYPIAGVPTLLIFKNGELFQTQIGIPKIMQYFETLKKE